MYKQLNTPQSIAPSNALPSKQAGVRGMADGGSPVLRGSPVRGYAERPTSPVLLSGSPVTGSPVRGYAEVQKMPASYGLMMEGQEQVLFHNCMCRQGVRRDIGTQDVFNNSFFTSKMYCRSAKT